MALAGNGVLAIWNGIAEEAEADFVAWHVREHIPERVAVPGFLRGRRYVAVAGRPKYFNFYETQTPDDLRSPAYIEKLNTPSEWTRRVVRHFQDTSRTICAVAASAGSGDGAFVAALRLTSAEDPERLGAAMNDAVIAPILGLPGIVGAHLLRGIPEAGQQATAEKALRSEPDRSAAWILLIEATDQAPLDEVLAGSAAPNALEAIGAASAEVDRGIYRLQFALARNQIARSDPDGSPVAGA